jgi:hypothetical protein
MTSALEALALRQWPRRPKSPVREVAQVSAPIAKHFSGTENPRHLRVIQALLTRPITREQLDRLAGCSNGPELIAELRRRGLELPCTRARKQDRDLFECWPGVYHLTPADRRKLAAWKRKRATEALK